MSEKIRIETSELEELREILSGVDLLHRTLGKIREQETRYLSKLINLRKEESNWERRIGEKYHLPSGLEWTIDGTTGELKINDVGEGKPAEPEVKTEEEKA